MSSVQWSGRSILFDLDGTLIDSQTVIDRHSRAWADRHGLDGDTVIARSHGLRDSEVITGLAPRADHEAELLWLQRLSCNDVIGIEAVRGATRLLAGLAPNSWGVVTSGTREVARARLAAAGLPGPEVLVAAQDVPRGKPAPDGFRLAARLLDADPSECLVFEDAPVGVQAASAAGMQVVVVGGGSGGMAICDFRSVRVLASNPPHLELRLTASSGSVR